MSIQYGNQPFPYNYNLPGQINNPGPGIQFPGQNKELVHGDFISQLPTDKNPPTNTEVQIIDTLFKNHSSMNKIITHMKDIFLVIILVIIFSLNQTDEFINKTIPATVNLPYTLLLVKGMLAGLIFFVIKYFYLSRK